MDLLNELITWRNRLADLQSVPKYLILPNQTLENIAQAQPTSLEQLSQISGIGPSKLSMYGGQILQIIDQSSESSKINQSSHSERSPEPVERIDSESLDQPTQIFQVHEYLEFANALLRQAIVTVEGEIGGVQDRGRYVFFNLLDPEQDAIISCFVWGHVLKNLGVQLIDGDLVRLTGYADIYIPRGRISFQVQQIAVQGEGQLALAYQQLLDRLEQQGLFSTDLKTDIPQYPRQIGLLTSAHGDALNDFLTHLISNHLQITHLPCNVEGIYALDSIISGIEYLNKFHPQLDVIVITRGGGSLESLHAYNTEDIARAIRASKIPIVSAVGHENDTTIADLAADYRCSTPTAAGQFLSQHWLQAQQQLDQYTQYLHHHISQHLTETKQTLISSTRRWATHLSRISQRIDQQQTTLQFHRQALLSHISLISQQLNTTQSSLTHNLISQLAWYKQILNSQHQILNSHNPQRLLEKGYLLAQNTAGTYLTSVDQVKINDTLTLHLKDGRLTTQVTNKTK